jgi:hypothetical protein
MLQAKALVESSPSLTGGLHATTKKKFAVQDMEI